MSPRDHAQEALDMERTKRDAAAAAARIEREAMRASERAAHASAREAARRARQLPDDLDVCSFTCSMIAQLACLVGN